MLNEDQYMERAPDLVAKIRRMREAAQKEMNRFTRLADYDVRRATGRKPKSDSVSGETISSPSAENRPKKGASKSAAVQASIQFSPASPKRNDEKEGA